jgi:hypothetical protein
VFLEAVGGFAGIQTVGLPFDDEIATFGHQQTKSSPARTRQQHRPARFRYQKMDVKTTAPGYFL